MSRRILTATLALALSALPAAPTAVAASAPFETAAAQQTQYGAIERGWRTGYSDGFQAGWKDTSERRASDFAGKEDYQSAERGYVASFGSRDEYRDGYRQGFEAGYGDGYGRRSFNSELPPGGVSPRGANAPGVASEPHRTSEPPAEAERDDARDDSAASASSARSASIPRDTILRVELLNRLSSDVSQPGDRFEARVIEPREYEGAVVSGRVAKVGRSGKVKGRAELQLDFDQIRLPGGDWADFHAQVVEVIPSGREDEAGEVDSEGGVRGRSSTKDDITKVGTSTGIGAVIGAIAGGGKGAAIGAIIGAGVGTGRVMTQRGKDIRFERGQQLRIRTSGESRLQ